jgi:type IV pilus assembly protein PilM
MAKAKAAWGIEVGSAAIKAIRLERDGSDVRVADFVVIPHPKVLTTPDLNIEEMLRISLGAFMTQKSLEGAAVLIGVPGNDSLSRFAKLPPIPKKAVPQTVMFEAKQQIPFPLEEVEWDYHLFASDDSPELEVGIFAVLKEKIAQRLSLYKELGLTPAAITLCPLAVYNCMVYDRDLDKPGRETIAFLDIGTRSSDLIVIADGHCWIRTFPIGGHHFTEAVATAFSVPYGKADRLKAEAATHKYAKQLMHAMRPVFDDLLQEVQRSMGHFHSIRPEKPISRIVGLGSTFRIPGLRKFLSDQLGVDIRRQEEYEKIKVEGSAAADFSANAMNLATACGLALQGLGFSEIAVNLSPVDNMREQVWRTKSKWFVAAACISLVASALLFWRPGGVVSAEVPATVMVVKREGESAKRQFEEAKTAADLGARANNMVFLLEDREVWPWIVNDVYSAVSTVGTQPQLLTAFDPKNPPIPYEQWNLVDVRDLRGTYKLDTSTPGQQHREIKVTMQLTVPRSPSGAGQAPDFVQNSVLAWLNKNADRPSAPYTIVIPPTGLVAKFEPHGSKGDSGSAIARNNTTPEETQEDQVVSETKTDGGGQVFSGRRTVTEQIDSPNFRPAGSGDGPSQETNDPVRGTGNKPIRSRPTPKPDSNPNGPQVEPVDLAKDAPIPSRPDLFAGRTATDVTITFTVRLKPPTGRTIAPPMGAAAEGAGEPTAEEGAQQ